MFLQWKRKNAFCLFLLVVLYVTANNIQLFRVDNYFIINLCQGQQCKYYVPDFEKIIFQPIFTLVTRYIQTLH